MPTPRYRSHKSGGGSWFVQFRLPHRKSSTKETFPTYQEAQAFCHLIESVGAARAVAIRNQVTDKPGTSLDSLEFHLNAYLKSAESHATGGTLYDYRLMAERTWLTYFKNQPAGTIMREDVEAWVAWQRKRLTRTGKPYSAKSIKNAHGLLSSVFQHAVKNKILSENPAKGVKLPHDTVKRDDQYIKPHEFEHLVAAFTDPDAKMLVIFLYLTGLRWGEATAVTVADLDLNPNDPSVRVNKAWKKGDNNTRYIGAPKSYRSVRTVSIPEYLRALLEAYVRDKKRKPNDLLFQNKLGKPIKHDTFYKGHWRPALKRCALDINPRIHDLRHSIVSNLIAQNVGLAVIQKIVGHESIETTVQRYGHLERSMFTNAARTLNEAIVSDLRGLPAPTSSTIEVID